MGAETKATWSSAYVSDLPDSAFACRDENGRHYPHHDASGAVDEAHVRAALSRLGDPNNVQCGKEHLLAHAKALGIGQAKALIPVKAQLMDTDELAAWFEGRTPRRLLAIPFGGPIPSTKSAIGVDLDGEYFDERTDIYGSVRALRETRERLVDWHHGKDPTGFMQRTIVAKSILDPTPEEEGYWSTVWIKAGERRVELIRRLAERGAELFGSSEAVYKKADPDGHIAVWPMYLQTLTTSPQNTYSVLRPAKARELAELNDTVDPALLRVLDDLDALGGSLSAPWKADSSGETAAIVRRELDQAIEPWEDLLRLPSGDT